VGGAELIDDTPFPRPGVTLTQAKESLSTWCFVWIGRRESHPHHQLGSSPEMKARAEL
jgi:hypothetical protein